MSSTLATERAEVAARAQEFIAGIATGGSTTTLADVNALTHADGYWDETTVLMTSGMNDGAQRRVQTFTAATSTLNFYSAMNASVASGNQYELYRRFTPGDVDRAINRAINVGSPDFREKARAVATAIADTLTYAFPTDPQFRERNLVGIEYQYYQDSTQSTWPFTKMDATQYEIIEDWVGSSIEKLLQLRFNPQTNRLIRFVYEGVLGNVATSTDLIHLDLPELEWLRSQSTCELWRIETSRTVDSNRKAALEEAARWEANADKLRRQLRHPDPQRPLRRTTFRTTLGDWRR